MSQLTCLFLLSRNRNRPSASFIIILINYVKQELRKSVFRIISEQRLSIAHFHIQDIIIINLLNSIHHLIEAAIVMCIDERLWIEIFDYIKAP